MPGILQWGDILGYQASVPKLYCIAAALGQPRCVAVCAEPGPVNSVLASVSFKHFDDKGYDRVQESIEPTAMGIKGRMWELPPR
jgi:hypothetical protein